MHGADRYASVLVMIRAALIFREIISITHPYTRQDNASQIAIVPSPRHIYIIYQYTWNLGGNISQLWTKCK